MPADIDGEYNEERMLIQHFVPTVWKFYNLLDSTMTEADMDQMDNYCLCFTIIIELFYYIKINLGGNRSLEKIKYMVEHQMICESLADYYHEIYHSFKHFSADELHDIKQISSEFHQYLVKYPTKEEYFRKICRPQLKETYINRCPKCQKIVRTQSAKQCCWCFHDWHSYDISD